MRLTVAGVGPEYFQMHASTYMMPQQSEQPQQQQSYMDANGGMPYQMYPYPIPQYPMYAPDMQATSRQQTYANYATPEDFQKHKDVNGRAIPLHKPAVATSDGSEYAEGGGAGVMPAMMIMQPVDYNGQMMYAMPYQMPHPYMFVQPYQVPHVQQQQHVVQGGTSEQASG